MCSWRLHYVRALRVNKRAPELTILLQLFELSAFCFLMTAPVPFVAIARTLLSRPLLLEIMFSTSSYRPRCSIALSSAALLSLLSHIFLTKPHPIPLSGKYLGLEPNTSAFGLSGLRNSQIRGFDFDFFNLGLICFEREWGGGALDAILTMRGMLNEAFLCPPEGSASRSGHRGRQRGQQGF